MNIFKKWFCKSEQKKSESVDLSKLQDHYILNVGNARCDFCSKETMNCCKIDLADQCVCIAPHKDIKGLRKPKTNKK